MDTVSGSVTTIDAELPTRISARGVIAGLLVGLALQLMLMVLGSAIGLSAFQPRGDVARGVGIGFAAWVLLTLIVSAFFGGWVASGAARALRRRDGVLHGLVTWAAVTLVGAALVGGALRSAVGGIVGVAKSAAQAAASSPAVNQAAREQAPGVQRTVDNALGQVNSTSRDLASHADQAAGAAAMGSWGLFAALLLPMLAAIGGGVAGAGRERRVSGLGDERSARRPTVHGPRHTGDVPTQPLPST